MNNRNQPCKCGSQLKYKHCCFITERDAHQIYLAKQEEARKERIREALEKKPLSNYEAPKPTRKLLPMSAMICLAAMLSIDSRR